MLRLVATIGFNRGHFELLLQDAGRFDLDSFKSHF